MAVEGGERNCWNLIAKMVKFQIVVYLVLAPRTVGMDISVVSKTGSG